MGKVGNELSPREWAVKDGMEITYLVYVEGSLKKYFGIFSKLN